MQVQYKLFRIDSDAVDTVIPLLDKYNYEKLSKSIVAVQYDYLNNGYKELLDIMSELSVSQYIVTTSVFYELLECFVKNRLEIYEIKLNDLFEEDNDSVLKYVQRINDSTEKDTEMMALLELLKWYNYDEGIDINHMTFGIETNGRKRKFHFYNNGVLAIDTEKIVDSVFELLKKYFER